MKQIKKLIFFCLIFFITGCSVEYNLTINDDNSINETVIASEKTKRMESLTRLKGDSAITYLYNMYKRNDKNMKINSTEDGNDTYSTVTTTHSSIDDYSKVFRSDVFNSVNVTRKNGIVTFETIQNNMLGGDTSYPLIYDDITVNITIPFKVTENNADKVSGSVYTWKINKDEDLKEIKFSYKEGNKRNSLNLKINNKTYNVNYALIVSSVIIVVLLVIFSVVYMKNKKNNVV